MQQLDLTSAIRPKNAEVDVQLPSLKTCSWTKPLPYLKNGSMLVGGLLAWRVKPGKSDETQTLADDCCKSTRAFLMVGEDDELCVLSCRLIRRLRVEA